MVKFGGLFSFLLLLSPVLGVQAQVCDKVYESAARVSFAAAPVRFSSSVQHMINRGFVFSRGGIPFYIAPHRSVPSVFKNHLLEAAKSETKKAVSSIWELWNNSDRVVQVMSVLREKVRQRMQDYDVAAEVALEGIRRDYEIQAGLKEPFEIREETIPNRELAGAPGLYLSDTEWNDLLAKGLPLSDFGVGHSYLLEQERQESHHVHRNQWLIVFIARELFPNSFEDLSPKDLGLAYRDLGGEWALEWKKNSPDNETPWFYLFDISSDYYEGEWPVVMLPDVGKPLLGQHFSMPEYFDLIFNRVFEEGEVPLP